MPISQEKKDRIDTLINNINCRKVFKEQNCNYLDMPDLKEIKDIIFNIDTDDNDSLLYTIDKVRYLAETYKKSIRIPNCIECYNYLAKLQIKFAKNNQLTLKEFDQIAWDALAIFNARNLYVYDDCEDIVDIFCECFDRNQVLSVLNEGKRLWFEGLKRDSIEMTEKFQNVLDEVEEAIDTKLKTDPNLDKWKLMKREFKKRGINWTSPAELNEGALFD